MTQVRVLIKIHPRIAASSRRFCSAKHLLYSSNEILGKGKICINIKDTNTVERQPVPIPGGFRTTTLLMRDLILLTLSMNYLQIL